MAADSYKKTGKFWERYNIPDSDAGREGRYKNQHGFGWTNAMYVKLVKELERVGEEHDKRYGLGQKSAEGNA